MNGQNVTLKARDERVKILIFFLSTVQSNILHVLEK